MKRLLAFWAILSCVFFSSGHSAASETYRDIPGVTKEEISAIEELKTRREKLSYGAVLATEAFVLPDGSYAGFAAKFCGLLSKLFEIPFVLDIYEWDALMENLESLSIDFTGELTPTEERRLKYSMTYPIAERELRIFTRADSRRIQTEADVNGLKLGFLDGVVTPYSIKRVYPVSFDRVDADNYQAAARMMMNGDIDAFVAEAIADPAFEDHDFIRSSIFFPMVHEPVSMTTANPELAPIISAVNKYLIAGGVDKLYELYREGDFEYARYKLHRSFTDEESAYIDDLKRRGASIGVAFEHDNYPVSFYNREEEEFQGIAVDVLAKISGLTDIKFEAVTEKDATWADMFEKVRTGEIDMVAQLLKSEARREHFIWSAVPYTRSYYAIMSREDFPNLATYQVTRATVGVMKQSGHEDTYRELFPDNDNLKGYDTLEGSLNALERGEVDLVMASEHMLLSQTNYREKTGFRINIKLNAPMDSYFGFYKGNNILCSIISKAQQYVPTDVIETSWTGRVFDYSKKLAEERAFFLTIFAGILLLILFITVFLFIKNLKLSEELRDLANKDALTDVLSRRCFMELGLTQIERSLRTRRECFIIIFDLDRFKAVNDRYGHLAGDKVLRETAQLVKKSMRPYDLLGRYGGEEFIVLMPDIDKANVINAAERIRLDVFKTPVIFEGKEIPISASFGIAYAAPVNDMSAAIKYADEALYQAKSEGRNRVVFSRHPE
jgi:diguanylate cyclase (GGDEF)-like protein